MQEHSQQLEQLLVLTQYLFTPGLLTLAPATKAWAFLDRRDHNLWPEVAREVVA